MTIGEKIGLPALLEQCAEECAELAHACLKTARIYRGENPTPASFKDCRLNLEEEIADVTLVMGAIIAELGIDPRSIENTCDFKLKRWNDRIDEAAGLITFHKEPRVHVNLVSPDGLCKAVSEEVNHE